MKTCTRCQTAKSETEFNKKRDGYQSACRECTRKQYKRFYDNNRERMVARSVRQKAAYRDEIRAYVQGVKEGSPCMDCGTKYPYYVMDFDHREGVEKVDDVGTMCNYATLNLVIIEIAKCDLVCSNCHRIRTHKRLMGH